MRLVPAGDGGGKATGAISHGCALALAARQHMAARVAEIKPQTAGAPVPGDESRPAHERLLYGRSGLVEPRDQGRLMRTVSMSRSGAGMPEGSKWGVPLLANMSS